MRHNPDAIYIFLPVITVGGYLIVWMIKRRVQTWGDIPKAIKKDLSDDTPKSLRFILDTPVTVSLVTKLKRLFL